MVPNIPDEPNSDPSSSYSSSLDLSDSSEDEYYKRRQRAKSKKIKSVVKQILMALSKSETILQPSYLHPRINKGKISANRIIIHYSVGFISYPS